MSPSGIVKFNPFACRGNSLLQTQLYTVLSDVLFLVDLINKVCYKDKGPVVW